MSEEKKTHFYDRTWGKWVIAIVILTLIMGLAYVLWKKPIRSAIAKHRAEKLYDLAKSQGLNPPPVDTLVSLYGEDGGATAATADSDIARALLVQNVNRGSGEVNQRAGIVDKDLLRFEYLVLQVYRPEAAAKYKEFIDNLKSGDTVNP